MGLANGIRASSKLIARASKLPTPEELSKAVYIKQQQVLEIE